MARKRAMTPAFISGTSRSYFRRGYSVPRFYDDTYIPRYAPPRHFLDTSGEENAIRKSVNRELMLTSNFVDDAQDLASSSHRRDEEILKHASQAIVDSEIFHNPRIAVAARRARSQPPQPLQVTPVLRTRASVPPRGASPPPRSYVRRANREVVVVVRPRSASVAAEVDFRKPVTAGWRYPRAYYDPFAYPWHRYSPRRNFYVDAPGGVDTRSHYMYGTSLAFPLYSRLYTPYLYQNGYDYLVPPSSDKYVKARFRVLASPLPYKKKFARKAALVGSKVDVVLPSNKRPRSKYAAAVIREINLKKHWAEEGSAEPADIPTSHLHASPKPVYLSRGGYFDDYEDIVKKPKSDILSWKHRLESRLAPKDLLFTPKVYANVRSQLRDVQEKMDRHRQLMDRYLEADSITTDRDVKTKVLAMYSEMEERDPLGILSTATTRNSAPITESSSIPSAHRIII